MKQEPSPIATSQSSRSRGRTVAAVVLTIIGCWCLIASLGVLAVYLFERLPLSDLLHSYLPIPAFVVGCVLLFISSRLWPRWRMGIGVTAVIEGAIATLAGPHLPGVFTIAIVGVVAGVAFIAWQKVVDQNRSSKSTVANVG